MKINKLIYGITILLLAASFGSCSKKNYPQTKKSNYLLAVGNTWIYEETYYYNNIWDSLRSKRLVTITIVKDTVLPEDQAAFVVEQKQGNNIYKFFWYEKDQELLERDFRSDHPSILYKTDMKKGMSWDMWPSLNDAQRDDERRVSEEFTSYPFQGKQIRAFRLKNGLDDLLQSGETGSLTEQLYAPGIGLIEQTNYSNFYGPTRTRRVLTDYFIK